MLANLFGTPRRVALAMGEESTDALREIGRLLAFLKEPDPPKGMRDAWKSLPVFRRVLDMAPRTVKSAPWHAATLEGGDVDLGRFPVQTCLAGRCRTAHHLGAGHHPRTVARAHEPRDLSPAGHRAEPGHHAAGSPIGAARSTSGQWRHERPGEPFPVSVALGADPATMLAAVTPIPDTLSEFAFAGLLRGSRTELVEGELNGLPVPASAEIVLEGHIAPDDEAPEGPFGDHTGYYNEVERFPVFTIARIHHRKAPIYHSTYTGRPPDEPAVLGVALNEVFVPLLQKQFPEITDFYLPPEGCFVPGRDRRDAQAVRGPCEAGDAGGVVVPSPVHVHQARNRHRRRHRRPRLEGRRVGAVHPGRPRPRHHHHREFAHRLPGLRLPRLGPRIQDGHRRHVEMARGDGPHMGPTDQDEPGGERSGRRDMGYARNWRLRAGLTPWLPSGVSICAGIRARLSAGLPSRNHRENDDMKAEIHPRYGEVNVTCSCGNTFKTRSTLTGELHLDVCSQCHPFYTGTQKIMDTAGRVDKFRRRYDPNLTPGSRGARRLPGSTTERFPPAARTGASVSRSAVSRGIDPGFRDRALEPPNRPSGHHESVHFDRENRFRASTPAPPASSKLPDSRAGASQCTFGIQTSCQI